MGDWPWNMTVENMKTFSNIVDEPPMGFTNIFKPTGDVWTIWFN